MHYEGIIQKLSRYQDIQLVSIIHFDSHGKIENYSHIEKRLNALPGIKYFGKTDIHQHRFSKDEQLIEYVKTAQQVFYISFGYEFFKELYAVPPNIPHKYIGEHDATMYYERTGDVNNQYHLNRSLGIGGKDHFGNPFQGIKLLDLPAPRSFEEHWTLISEKDPNFAATVRACTNTHDATSLSNGHTLITAYFNRSWDFFEFLRMFTVIQPNTKKSIIIQYSGNDLLDFIRREKTNYTGTAFKPHKKPFLEQLFASGDIKALQIISSSSDSAADPLTLAGNPKGKIFISILNGFYLSDDSLHSLYQISDMVGVSGDNSIELAISLGVLPFYCSTNWFGKTNTLEQLRNITQLSELNLSPAARQSFDIFFNTTVIHTRRKIFREFCEYDRTLCLEEYSKINLPAMIAAWPMVAAYIREHSNFYDRLDSIVREKLPEAYQPHIESEHLKDASNALISSPCSDIIPRF